MRGQTVFLSRVSGRLLNLCLALALLVALPARPGRVVQPAGEVPARVGGPSLAALAAGQKENRGPQPMPPSPDLWQRYQRGEVQLPAVILDADLKQQRGIDQPAWPGPGPFGRRSTEAGIAGTWNALALLVQFSDNPRQVSASYFDTLLFSPSGSTLNNYYKAVSYGALDIVTVNLPGSLGWKTLPQTYAYYVGGQNGLGSYPQNAQRMAEDAVKLANSVVDFSKYDNNGDGWVDTVFIIHAGPGAEVTGSANHIWSHSWVTYNSPTLDGVKVGSYTTEPEYWFAANDMTMGVYAHELGHALGLPDLYDYGNDSEGAGNWSLMGGGSWNGNHGDSPAFPDAWSRARLGFVSPTTVIKDLTAASIPAAESSQTVYRLSTGGQPGSEYYLVENRQQLSYDAALPAAGLLIWHIDELMDDNDTQCLWQNNWRCAGHYLVSLEQADGLYNLEWNANGGDAGDPYPGSSSKRSFNFTSRPNSSSYYGSADTLVEVSSISDAGPVMTANLLVGVDASCTDAYEANNTPAQAAAINYGDKLTDLRICPTGDVDYFSFSALGGEVAVVDIDAASQGSVLDSYLELYDLDGTTRLAANDTYNGSLDAHLEYTLPAAGRYYLKVKAAGGSVGGSAYFYHLSLASKASPDSPKPWTFMVYLDGDNNLEAAGVQDFIEMAQVGSNAQVNLLVQMDRLPDYEAGYGDWSDTRRFYVTPGMLPWPEHGLSLGEANMGAGQTLRDFIQWGMTNYPAERYALVLWDHGGGWPARLVQAPPAMDIAWDDTDGGDALDMTELRSALSTVTGSGAAPLDLLGFDAGLMGMIEVDQQVIPYASVRVGSQEKEPEEGWDYGPVLNTLASDPAISPLELGRTIVDAYASYYPEGNTQAVVDLGAPVAALNQAVDAFAGVLISRLGTYSQTMAAARTEAQSYSYAEYIDLYDFARLAGEKIDDSAIDAAAAAVMTAVDGAVYHEQHGAAWAGTHGISIYFPPDELGYDDRYDGSQNYLQFAVNTRWDEFLRAYYAAFPPGPFAKLTPGNGDTHQSTNLVLAWGASSGAASYEYCIDMTPGDGCTAPATWESTGKTTRLSLPGLAANTTYSWQVRARNSLGVAAANGDTWWSFVTAPGDASILLVDDDDNDPNVQAAYTGALEGLGLSYHLWSTGGSDFEPAPTVLDNYQTVIWFTGDSYTRYTGPGASSEGSLGGWLDSGKCLLLSSQDYAYVRGKTAFLTGYLGVAGVANDAGKYTSLTGQGAFAGLGAYTLSYPFRDYADTLTPAAGADAAWQGENGHIAGVSRASPLYRTTFWAYPFEAIAEAAGRQATLARFITWCGLPYPFDKTAPASGAAGQPTNLALSWTASRGAAGYAYCYDQSNDDACDTGWIDAGSATGAALSNLAPDATYYWQVRATNASGSLEAGAGWWSLHTLKAYPRYLPLVQQ